MNLTHKERIRKAISYEPIDMFPTQINFTKRMGNKISNYYKIKLEELPNFLNNHLIRLDLSFPKRYSEGEKIEYDWWGVGFDSNEEGYFTAYNPMNDTTDLDQFPWPDPTDPGLLDKAKEVITSDNEDHFILCNFGFVLFERAWSLRGFQNFLMDMAIDSVFAEELLEKITDIQLVLIQRFIELGVDGGYFGDDYGSQNNLLFSPRLWRKIIKPRLSKMFSLFRDANLPIFMHSDGNISDILPDLVDIGLTTLNPVQPEVLDHLWLKKRFGTNLSYYGGISTQTVLPAGSPIEVEQAIFDCIAKLSSNNSGVILAPSHRIMTDIPMENIDALRDTFNKLGG